MRRYVPNHTVGCKGKPGLEDEGHDACPVKDKTHLKLHYHVAKSDVIDNEGKCMHKGKDEKRIGYPSVEDLKLLVRDAREERDPVRLARRCAAEQSVLGGTNAC